MSTITALYVDDEPDLLEIARLFLEQAGEITVDTCTSPLEGQEKLNTARYDVIISDYQMPEMDGIAFLKTVRSAYGTIPFILFTGRGREEVVIEAINNGADFYLQKGGAPQAQFAELSHKIRQVVQGRRAEATLHDLERRESDIINFLPDATFAIDLEGRVIAWNRAMERMTGILAGAIVGRDDHEYAAPFYRERRPILIDLVLKNDPDTAGKYPFIKREGKTLFSEVFIPHMRDGRGATLWFTATPLYDVGGVVVGAIESIRDITDRKRVEERLRESEEKFREMADMLPQIVFEVDTRGTLTYTNAIAFEMFGYTQDEFDKGLMVSQMLAPESQEQGMRTLGAIMAGNGKPAPGLEYRARRKDGSTFPITIYTDPIVRNDRVVGARGIIIDISGQKHAEEILQDRERVLSVLISNLPGFVYRCNNDRAWTTIYLSEGCRAITGYFPEDFLGNRIVSYNDIIRPDHRERLWQKWQALLGRREVFEDEYPVITKSGETRWVWERGQGYFSEDGQLQFLEGFITDVTRRKQAEEALAAKTAELEKKSRYYEQLLRTSTDAIHVIDRDGRLREWNDAFLAHLGCTAEDAAGMSLRDWDIGIPDGRQKERIAELISSGETFETRHRRRDGTVVDVEIRAASVVIEGEDLLYASARDITGRKRAEALIRESETRFRNIVESFEDLYYETDSEGIIRYLSPSCHHLTGFLPEELVGKPVLSVYSEEKDRRILFDAMQKTGYVRDYELVLKKRDGTQTPVSLSAHLMHNPDGSPAGIAGSLRDITLRKKAEEEIQKSREHLALTIEGSGAGIWDWNIQTGNLIVNERWAEIAGYSVQELEPVSIQTWTTLCHPDDLRRSGELLQKYFSGEMPVYECEARMRHADGRWIWVLDRGKVVEWDGEHKPVRMTGTHVDITRIKQMEGALRQANEKLNLLSSITRHDISNQLVVLRGFLEISKGNLADPARMADYIAKEEKIAETLENQIAFTRHYQDMGVREPAWQNIDEHVRRAAASFSPGAITIRADCPGLDVYADPLFEKVFYNLIDNALRYGGTTMTMVRISSHETDGGLVLVCEDNGAGISAGDKAHLFEWGFGKNTGLGLFLVREILGITGITIQETGEPGKGARFELLVPKGGYRYTP